MAQSTENKKTFYLVLILILILLNLFFAYNHWNARQQLVKTTQEKNTLDSLLTIAKDSLQSNGLRITSLQGKNNELDNLLNARQAELQAAIEELEKLKKEGNYTQKQLNEARGKIKALQEENKKFLARIDSLNTQVQLLTRLSDSLNVGLQTEMAQKLQLQSEKDMLAQKVEIGSILKPMNVEASGIFLKSNDREVPTTKAKKTERLKICFDVPENKVADPGAKQITLRILNPQGATIAVESEGSGTFKTSDGEQMQYTTLARFDYKQQQQRVCAYWRQTQAFGSGKYQVFFYQDGKETHKHEFELK